MPPTPQYTWPLLNRRAGLELWTKHENHTPICAFKIRSALTYLRRLRESGAASSTIVTATRGNYGQAVAFAAAREGLRALIYVPRGNSASKNRAMCALGATLVEFGDDFEDARRESVRRAAAENLHVMPPFHPWLVEGTATYAWELFEAVPPLDAVYVPIGMGSGICGMCAARDALSLDVEIVGVVSAHARSCYESFVQHRLVESPASTRLADGMACRAQDPLAMEWIWSHVSRILTVTDDEIAAAMRAIYDDTHNLVEGAGAAGVAGVLQDRERLQGKRVATVISGANIDRELFAAVLGAALD
jgi:threonine dehydratase